MLKAIVYVTLRESVLDPQGSAVKGALHTLGFAEVADVRIGKYMEVALETDDREQAVERVREMAEKLLANTVIEDYRFEIVEG
ncbi:phosphoribosylformylglycinamidine synthase subunit PurS [Brevibacillus fulvus]|uniref:Phosphoribosylformylglycinamidine synthase subunit PurS n=1 Tax=Brevibacillus fulvus TaxID=1125967 RepID=A0A939BTI8_9BACL|nr:phosphoribosylformylglycinamidine synthase subunit PurS [Brevibacillus fulvus]MBM7589519.1 phosphoribosylformylglycinamidine synthase [Brevibacillus fulvus]